VVDSGIKEIQKIFSEFSRTTGPTAEFAKLLEQTHLLEPTFKPTYVSVFKDYLAQQGLPSWDIRSIYNPASSYFSVPNILDTYGSYGETESSLAYIQQFFLQNTRTYAMDVMSMLKHQDVSSVFNFEVLLKGGNFSPATLETFRLKEVATSMARELQRVTAHKLDIDLLIDVFPEFGLDIASFDMPLENEEITLYQTLSTPDFKLYYPEPFIASPSFVHEEL
jgi:hypothetical protein